MSDKVTKKKEFTTPPISSHLLEKLEKLGVSKGKMTEIPTS
jgi:hypothetical protein